MSTDRELMLTGLIAAPAPLEQWFAPKPCADQLANLVATL